MNVSLHLLPCPFCDAEAKWNHAAGSLQKVGAEQSGEGFTPSGAHWIDCPACGASTNLRYSLMDDCRPALAEQWNRRTPRRRPHGAPLPIAPLQELHDLLYSAQRTVGAPQARAIGAARLVLHRLRAAQQTVAPLPPASSEAEIKPLTAIAEECGAERQHPPYPGPEDFRWSLSAVQLKEFAAALVAREQPHADATEPTSKRNAQRLDYLQVRGATVEILPDGPGWKFRIGGLHKAVSHDVRSAIDAAIEAQTTAALGEQE